GPHLCADLPVLAVLGSGLPEPTSLDCRSFNPTRNSFPAIHQCLYQLFRSSRPATNRRFADSAGSLPLLPQMAHAADSILHSQRTAASRRGTPAVLLASRALRQSDLLAPGCRGPT